MRFAVFGAGALGGCLGGRLAADGNEVVFVARGVQREALSARGLKLLAPDENFHIEPVALYEDAASAGLFDFVLICVRDSQTDSCIELVKPLLAVESAVLVLQNGMATFRRFAQLVGRARLMGGCAELSAEQVAFFHESGFISGVNILDDAQVAALCEELESLLDPCHSAADLWYECHSNESMMRLQIF